MVPTVQPGKGIVGICEIGMKYKTIKEKSDYVEGFHIAKESASSAYFIVLPPLGTAGLISTGNTNDPVDLVVLYVTEQQRDFDIKIKPFCGEINGLVFNGEEVSQESVEATFGQITNTATGNAASATPFEEKGEPYIFLISPDVKYLVYENIGVTFHISSNLVQQISIYPPRKGAMKNKAKNISNNH
jgi:hypothetical protein